MKENYENLANAIIKQSARDYIWALRKLKRNPENIKAIKFKKEVECFVHSVWYRQLTTLDGDLLLEKLKVQAELCGRIADFEEGN